MICSMSRDHSLLCVWMPLFLANYLFLTYDYMYEPLAEENIHLGLVSSENSDQPGRKSSLLVFNVQFQDVCYHHANMSVQ